MSDKETIAIGAIQNDGSASNAGHVRIFKWNGTSWIQKGSDIDGEAANDNFGISVSFPDSNYVAIGAYRNDGTGSNAGHVRVFRWNGSTWQQQGNDIDGETIGDESGKSIFMPDSLTVAIGAAKNDGSGSNAGHVRIYRWNGSSWQQKGSDLDGPGADYNFGRAVCMPDSNTVAISSKGNIFEAGEVQIYEWNGTAWNQKGSTIIGEATFDLSGDAVSMPSPNFISIGAANNNGGGSQSGHARIFEWNGTNWVQKGSDIDGEAANNRCGASVSMPDSNTVAVGANWNGGTGVYAGHTRIFKWNGLAWTQEGNDIDGEAAQDQSGYSVSMPDASTVAIGAYFNGGNGAGAGHTRVFQLCNNGSTDTVVACGLFMWIDGNTYTSSNDTATFTLTNAAGCDSVVTLNLTINTSNTGTDVITACDSYQWIDGNTYTASNSSATFTETNAAGCDSVVTLNLSINNSNTGIDVVSACDSYTWIDGNTYTSSNDTATFTLTNAAGCDSVVTLNLTINSISNSVTQTGFMLTADQAGAIYQWLDCNDNYAEIADANAQSYIPISNGDYAVAITDNNCTDTSACFIIAGLGLKTNNYEEKLAVYPNPTDGNFQIDLETVYQKIDISISHMNGQLIRSKSFNQAQLITWSLNEPPGLYLITVQTDNQKYVIKLIKN